HRHSTKLAEVLTDTAGLPGFARIWRQIVKIDLRVTWNKKIEPPVAVIITPGGPSTPTLARYAKLLSHISKSSITVVVIEPRNAEVAYEDVRPSVVIIIADCDSHTPAFIRHPSLFGHVFKLPVAQIVIQRGARRFLFSLHRQKG